MSDFIIPDDDILDEDFFDTPLDMDIEEEDESFMGTDYDPEEWN